METIHQAFRLQRLLTLLVASTRGKRLGNPANLRNQEAGRVQGRAKRSAMAAERAADLRPIIADVQGAGEKSLRQIAAKLNQRGISDGAGWKEVGGSGQTGIGARDRAYAAGAEFAGDGGEMVHLYSPAQTR
jgi:hypothetical protein